MRTWLSGSSTVCVTLPSASTLPTVRPSGSTMIIEREERTQGMSCVLFFCFLFFCFSSVIVYRNGGKVATVTADGNGNWSYTSGNLANGTYAFTATATDL